MFPTGLFVCPPDLKQKRSSFDRIIWLGYFAIVAAFQSSYDDGFLPIWYVIYYERKSICRLFRAELAGSAFFVFPALPVFFKMQVVSARFFAIFCKIPHT